MGTSEVGITVLVVVGDIVRIFVAIAVGDIVVIGCINEGIGEGLQVRGEDDAENATKI